jgi:glycosyltransferase involved in cell wall biosynthesis
MEINVQYDFRYLIIGDGPLRKTIEDKIKQSGLSEKVKLLGRVKNVHEYLRMADYFIHSSRGEGISNAILEAMFTGLPVIATSTGGTPELVYKKSFLLFNYKDLETLKKVLSNVDNQFKEFDPESEEYKLHLSKFTTDTMLKNFENIFNMIKQNEHR